VIFERDVAVAAPRAIKTEVQTLCIVALLCNEDFRLRLFEWFA